MQYIDRAFFKSSFSFTYYYNSYVILNLFLLISICVCSIIKISRWLIYHIYRIDAIRSISFYCLPYYSNILILIMKWLRWIISMLAKLQNRIEFWGLLTINGERGWFGRTAGPNRDPRSESGRIWGPFD